jgi:DNA-binding transcriptional ArsR family regulator
MLTVEEAQEVADVLKGLSDPLRVRVYQVLLAGPQCVTELAKLINIPMVNLSHHLKVMKVAGILQSEKRGRQVLYQIPEPQQSIVAAGVWYLHVQIPPVVVAN